MVGFVFETRIRNQPSSAKAFIPSRAKISKPNDSIFGLNDATTLNFVSSGQSMDCTFVAGYFGMESIKSANDFPFDDRISKSFSPAKIASSSPKISEKYK